MKSFYSNGKLLLTGEYAVLDGALGLAVPTSLGQSLKVGEIDAPHLVWKSFDEKGSVWFECVLEMDTLFSKSKKASENPVSETLVHILQEAKKLNPSFLIDYEGCKVETVLDFPRNWGLGSSSTLINNIAQWAEVDAYHLLWNAFSGSGYDIACAQNDSAILYRLKNGKPVVEPVDYTPPFADRLFFIHLDKKQDSRKGIARYRKMEFDTKKLIQQISEITENICSSPNLSDFEDLLTEHERLISRVLQLPTVKASLFPDYDGAIKSLGAWGGDFVLATGNDETPAFFKHKGYTTLIPYNEMVLNPKG